MNEHQVWTILSNYFKFNGIVSNQIESYNNFINFGLQNIIDNEPSIIVFPKSDQKYEVKFGQVYISNPQVIEDDRTVHPLYPGDARLRDLNYDTAIHCDITETFTENKEVDTKHHTRIMIGRIPVMLRSSICNLTSLTESERIKTGECPNDHGGYFVVKGNERVLVGQIRASYNQIIVSKQKPDDKYNYKAEVRSMSAETGHSVLIQALIGNDDRSVYFSLPCIREPIYAGIVFKALGFTNDEDIINLIGIDHPDVGKFIRYITRDSFFIKTPQDALAYIGKFPIHIITKDKETQYAWQVVETELLPHMGISGTIKEQAMFLGNMLNKLLATRIGIRNPDNRDNFALKRVEVAGALMYEIFRNLIKKYMNFIKGQLEKKKQRPDIISLIARNKIITKGLQHCLSTGNWGVQKNASYMRTGVSQILDRMTYGATLSHLRRILIPIGKEGKNVEIRQIHGSQIFFVCPSETPEGKKAGIVLNFSLLSKATKMIPTVPLKSILEKAKTIISTRDTKLASLKTASRVFLNGMVIGTTIDPQETLVELRKLRRRGIIDPEVSITFDTIDNDLKILSDEGRFIRPLLTVDSENKLKIASSKNLNWDYLVNNGFIEYVDASEIENSVIAMTHDRLQFQPCDYCEIHPSTILGIIGSIIPFPDHSQSPRNCYQCSMGKQALGTPLLSYNLRTDTVLYTLHYPQRPLVYTKASEMLGFNKMPAGLTAIVAIACYTGANQEDSVIMNKSAVQRGLFSITCYKTYDECERKRDMYSFEEIRVPPMNSDASIKQEQGGYFKRKNANYSLLDENGVVRVRTKGDKGSSIYVNKGDVIIGKVIVSTNKSGEQTFIDASRVVQHGEEGYIDRVYTTITPNGYKLVKVVIRKVRIPTLGDKVASRSAQKGTIGMMYPQEDMPFTEQGIVPDIIINPHSQPSRMTVNQLIECVLGKVSVLTGTDGDATPFTENSKNISSIVTNELSKHGFERHGWERMYNGFTGEQIAYQIFIGPTYYQRLKHMVDDKMHFRAKGQVTALVRQPLEGRSKDGGLRFGEMERDSIISHGASRFLKERLFDVSDPFQVPVCKKCGIITASTKECQACKGDNVVMVNFPYASKLLVQELNVLGMKVQLVPKE